MKSLLLCSFRSRVATEASVDFQSVAASVVNAAFDKNITITSTVLCRTVSLQCKQSLYSFAAELNQNTSLVFYKSAYFLSFPDVQASNISIRFLNWSAVNAPIQSNQSQASQSSKAGGTAVVEVCAAQYTEPCWAALLDHLRRNTRMTLGW